MSYRTRWAWKALTPSRSFAISRTPPPVTPRRSFLPVEVEADPFADPPPKLYAEQPDDVTSTREPPLKIYRSWSKNSGRNKSMKRRGYLFAETQEDFGPPRFILPGDEEKAPIPFLDLSIWRNAVVLIDKPKRCTSFDVCSKLRNATFRYPFKVGHSGTLDPLATGLLIVCMGNATKCVEKFVGLDKEYAGTMKLGETTKSYDAAEPISERRPWEHITDEMIECATEKFVGEIEQLPPMYSAVKKNGKRLYEYARKSLIVGRETRSVVVSQFDVKRLESSSQVVHYRIRCSSGTYVRSLVHDLGQALGCGAYVRSLRRNAIGPYTLSSAWELQKLLHVVEASKIASQ